MMLASAGSTSARLNRSNLRVEMIELPYSFRVTATVVVAGTATASTSLVSVYQGSLIVNYAITTDDGDKEALK